MFIFDKIKEMFSRWFGSDNPKPEQQASQVGLSSHTHLNGSHVLTGGSPGSQGLSSQPPRLSTSVHSAIRVNTFDIVCDNYSDSFRCTTTSRVSTSSGSTDRGSTSEVYDPYQCQRRNAALPQVTMSHTSKTRDNTFGVSSSGFRTSDVSTSRVGSTGVSQPRVSTAGVGSIGVSPYRASTVGSGVTGVSKPSVSTAGVGSIGASPYRASTTGGGATGVNSPRVSTAGVGATGVSTTGAGSIGVSPYRVSTAGSGATGVSKPSVSTAGVGLIGVSQYRISTASVDAAGVSSPRVCTAEVGATGVSAHRVSTAGVGATGVSAHRVSTAGVGAIGVSAHRVSTAGVGATGVSAHRVSTAGVNEYRVTAPEHRSPLVNNNSSHPRSFSSEQLGARTSVSNFNEVQEQPVRVPTTRANSAASRGFIADLNRASLQNVENHIRSFYSEDVRDLNGYGDFSGSNQAHKVDQTVTWFRQRISRPRHTEPDGLPREMKVDMINLDLTDRHQDIAAAVAQLRRTYLGDGDEILFHATRAEAAVNILRSGIDLTMCKGRRDFSDNYGFYTTPDYNKCITWALRKSNGFKGSSAAIIAFRISRQLRQVPHLMLETKTQQGRGFWRRIIKYFRLGHSSSMIQQSLNAVKYIRGPVLANATMGHTDTPHWIPFDQICICDAEYAKQFGSLNNVCFVVFFRDPNDDDEDENDYDDDDNDEEEEDDDEDDESEEEEDDDEDDGSEEEEDDDEDGESEEEEDDDEYDESEKEEDDDKDDESKEEEEEDEYEYKYDYEYDYEYEYEYE